MGAIERFGNYSGVITEAMEGIACREMQGSREKVWGVDIFPSGLVVKNLRANAGTTEDVGSIPGSGRSPGEGNGNHSSIFAWEIPRTEEPRWALVHGVAESDMTY